VVVAYMVYDGFNQEDSVIFNKGAVDQGLFNGYYYTYEECQVRYNEFVDQITATQPANVHGNYMKLKNGIIPTGVWVEKGDVLVAKKE
jgi:DNA-directed RNA polymerase II subunit RPB2